MKINYLGNVLNQSNIIINYLVHSLSTSTHIILIVKLLLDFD